MDDVAVKLDCSASTLKMTLGDALVFMNWLEHVHRAYEDGDPLPPIPDVESDRVKSWIQLVGKLHARHRQTDDTQMSLEANLEAQDTEVGRLLTNLHENIASLYDTLGQAQKAQEVRRRAAAVYSA